MMRARPKRQKSEPTITLINIVFLMLIFFLVAGTLAQPLDTALSLVRAQDLSAQPPEDALLIDATGGMSYRGVSLPDIDAYADSHEGERSAIRIVPDRDLSAMQLVQIANQLRAAGAERVILVTERGME
ncbi:ExbD/TolR family protein [Donghicola sp. XS_ASV15]|uniref:ExbD/TolR family protein n=1 Tax=Donghicola sp. XS_ASV15 TaxID=3241295 RepID=UPI003511AB35